MEDLSSVRARRRHHMPPPAARSRSPTSTRRVSFFASMRSLTQKGDGPTPPPPHTQQQQQQQQAPSAAAPPSDLPTPRTIPFDTSFPLGSDDLPLDRPPLARPAGAGPADPHQIHLSLASGSGGGGVWVSWATGDGSVGSGRAAPPRPPSPPPKKLASVVQFGPAPDRLDRTATGASEAYTQAYPGGRDYTSPRLHHVHLSAEQLKGGGPTIFYRVGDPAPGGAWSRVISFTPPSAGGVGTYPLRLGVLGDLGQTHNSSTTLAHLTAVALDDGAGTGALPAASGGVKAASAASLASPAASAVLYLGDMSYADDWNPDGSLRTWPAPPIDYTPAFGPKWDAWGRFTEPLFSAIPLISTAGNHEVETDADGRTFQAWRARYKSGDGRKTGGGLEATAPLYASFDLGPLHVISLNTYAEWSARSQQRAWLEEDLKAVNRSATPWVVALMHAPWYSSYASHYREVECMRLELEGLLEAGGVDAVFSGHVHAYERTTRVLDRVPQPDAAGCAPRYVVAGDGGNLERLYTVFTSGPGPALCPDPAGSDECGRDQAAAAAAEPTAPPFCDASQPPWSALRQPAYGFGTLDILSPTRAVWSWYSNLDGKLERADVAEWGGRSEACATPAGRADAAGPSAGPVPSAKEVADAARAKASPAAGFAPPPPAELPSQLAAAAAAGVAPPPP